MSKAQVTRYGAIDMQVCVPADWADDQVLAFAEREYPCVTANGWVIRKEGDKDFGGWRNSCTERAGYVHIMLDA